MNILKISALFQVVGASPWVENLSFELLFQNRLLCSHFSLYPHFVCPGIDEHILCYWFTFILHDFWIFLMCVYTYMLVRDTVCFFLSSWAYILCKIQKPWLYVYLHACFIMIPHFLPFWHCACIFPYLHVPYAHMFAFTRIFPVILQFFVALYLRFPYLHFSCTHVFCITEYNYFVVRHLAIYFVIVCLVHLQEIAHYLIINIIDLYTCLSI